MAQRMHLYLRENYCFHNFPYTSETATLPKWLKLKRITIIIVDKAMEQWEGSLLGSIQYLV